MWISPLPDQAAIPRKLVRKRGCHQSTLNLVFNIIACKLKDYVPINAPSVCFSKRGANGIAFAYFDVILPCYKLRVVFRQRVLVRRNKAALRSWTLQVRRAKGDARTQRGFSWALLSWHCFHPETGDHATVEPEYVLQHDFSKITLFKYFILILFLSRGPNPLNRRQFCFPSCQQYFGYFKNVGQG